MEYHFILMHKPGVSNHADHLSRRPDYDTGLQDNENVVVLPPKLFANATRILTLEGKIYEVQEGQRGWIEEVKQEFALDQVDQHWFYRGRLVVPEDEDIRREVLFAYHNHELAGHPGISNTVIAVTREFWWPKIREFMAAYV
jgi:hypothetical protein